MKVEIKVVLGNCIEEMNHIGDKQVHLIIADPPYNLGKNYGNNHDLIGFEQYLDFSRIWLKEAHRILRDDGTIYVFMGVRFISYLYHILDKELGMFFNSWITWHYTQGVGKRRGFSPRHEDILMFTKTEAFNFNLDHVRIPQKYYRKRNNMKGANPGDVWEFSHVHYSNPERENHPTQKPEALIKRMLLASSDEGDFIVDPFAGSGTTLRVCQQLNRRCLGIELNPQYVELINDRLKKPFQGFDSIDPRMNRTPKDLPKNNTPRQRGLFEQAI